MLCMLLVDHTGIDKKISRVALQDAVCKPLVSDTNSFHATSNMHSMSRRIKRNDLPAKKVKKGMLAPRQQRTQQILS
jgi:hypothetical protein